MFPQPDFEKKPRPLWVLDVLLIIGWVLAVAAVGIVAFN